MLLYYTFSIKTKCIVAAPFFFFSFCFFFLSNQPVLFAAFWNVDNFIFLPLFTPKKPVFFVLHFSKIFLLQTLRLRN